jgi:hypothetical protein
MMDPKKVAAWIAIPGLTIAALLGLRAQWGGFEADMELIAQEAGADTAVILINQHAEVAEARLGQLVHMDRVKEDRELTDRCEIRAERRGEEPLDYEQACVEESNLRWLWWEFDDCEIAKRKDCVEPMRDRP